MRFGTRINCLGGDHTSSSGERRREFLPEIFARHEEAGNYPNFRFFAPTTGSAALISASTFGSAALSSAKSANR